MEEFQTVDFEGKIHKWQYESIPFLLKLWHCSKHENVLPFVMDDIVDKKVLIEEKEYVAARVLMWFLPAGKFIGVQHSVATIVNNVRRAERLPGHQRLELFS